MKEIVISLIGCDDTTTFKMTVSDEEHAFLLKVATISKETSSYECMPTMEIQEGRYK